MMPLRQSSGIVSLIQTQFIITCSHRRMHSHPNFRSSAVTLHIPAALSLFSDFTAFRTSSSVTSSSDIDKSVGAFAAAVDVSELCGTGSLKCVSVFPVMFMEPVAVFVPSLLRKLLLM